jgi:hypothetical protein
MKKLLSGDVGPLRLKFLIFQYWLTIFVTIPLGLLVMLFPDFFQRVGKIGRQDHTFFGISGSVYVAFGLLSILALRNPKKWSPIILLQFTYKVLWFTLVMGRRIKSGELKMRWTDVAMMIGYGVFVAGDILAIPPEYLFFETTSQD